MADTMKMEYKIFLEAEDVSQSRILSCASYMKRVLESCNNRIHHHRLGKQRHMRSSFPSM